MSMVVTKANFSISRLGEIKANLHRLALSLLYTSIGSKTTILLSTLFPPTLRMNLIFSFRRRRSSSAKLHPQAIVPMTWMFCTNSGVTSLSEISTPECTMSFVILLSKMLPTTSRRSVSQT